MGVYTYMVNFPNEAAYLTIVSWSLELNCSTGTPPDYWEAPWPPEKPLHLTPPDSQNTVLSAFPRWSQVEFGGVYSEIVVISELCVRP